MKNSLLLLAFFFCLPSMAQGLGTESFYLTPQPWNGDWIPERYSIMVDGETYRGWPGPLPKMFYLLGMDPDHPGTEFELRERVDRDAAHWFGTCNGWAAAATLYSEPEAVVVNGVKLFSGETKGILASIWKDNIEITLGNYDSVGLTPESVEYILYAFIANDKPVIFDVVLGVESWNYPVAGFTRTATQNGDWTDVSLTIRYTNSLQMSLLEGDPGTLRFLEINYTYRYNSQGRYEWRGDSVNHHPQRAWVTNTPYVLSWFTRANRSFNMSTYTNLQSLSRQTGQLKDRFEPNDRLSDASLWTDNLAMGTVFKGDTDMFRLEKRAGEPVTLQFEVYDGVDVDISLLDAQGQVLDMQAGVCLAELSPGDAYEGTYYLKIEGLDTAISFYHLKYEGIRSFLREPQSSHFAGGSLKVINPSAEPATLAAQELMAVPAAGYVAVSELLADRNYTADNRVVFALENADEHRVYKRYDREHRLHMPYVVPQLTCRNGWKTSLHLTRTNNDPVLIKVFGSDGQAIESATLPSGNDFDLGSVLTNAASAQGTWFTLETSHSNQLSGLVTFSHDGLQYSADFSIDSRPRHGEQVVTNIPTAGQGWVGLSLVNTSGITNHIMFRLYDDDGRLVEDGEFELAPGHKWMGVPANLVSSPLEANYTLWLFSQYQLDTLALYHDLAHGVDYAQRIPNPILDFTSETYATPSTGNLDEQAFLIVNPTKRVNYVTFRGFNAQGEEILTHRFGGEPLRSFDSRFFTMGQLYRDAGVDPQTTAITHFKVTNSQPIVITELLGLPGHKDRTSVTLPSIYQRP